MTIQGLQQPARTLDRSAPQTVFWGQRSPDDVRKHIQAISREIHDILLSARYTGTPHNITPFVNMLRAEIYALRWSLGGVPSEPFLYCTHCGSVHKGDVCPVCGSGV